MVDRIFEVIEDNSSSTGFLIKETVTDKVLELPSICIEEFDLGAKHVRFCDMYKKMSTVRIALAGVTDSLNIVNQTYFDRNSVFKSYGLKKSNTIDDEIDGYLTSAKDYEVYHTIEMGRDKSGDDNSIHAYLYTPKDGRLRCKFDKNVRLEAKRNNVTFWVDDYKIVSGSNGGKFVQLIGQYEEIFR